MSDYASQFRLLVDHLDAADPEDQLVFFRMLDLVKTEVVQELSPRLLLASSPVAFRMLVAEAAYFYPSTGWIQPLCRALRREPDLGVYGVCVRALARIGTSESNEELRLLSSVTHEPTKRELLSLALHSSDPDRAFEHHLGRLFSGSSNPNIANQAAAELRQIVGPDHLEKLMVAVYHEDLLISRHVLKLITCVSCWEAGQFLCSYFLECHQDILDDRILKETLATLRPLPPVELWPVLVAQVESRFEDRVPSAVEGLKAAGVSGGVASLAAVETLKNWARGTVEPFLLDAIVLLLEGRATRLATLFADALAGLQARTRRTPHSLDTCAAGLELMVARGIFVAEDVLDLLYQAFLAQTGRETTARVLGTFLAPTDYEHLEAILATHDSALRAAALDSIAARHDARFLSFLLKACRDPIEDVAGRMILAAGGLEGAEDRALSLLTARAPEDVALGLRLVRLNRMAALSSQVLAFLDASTREDLSLEAVAVLGDFATADDALLKHLHSGQSARMQTALAEALAGRDPSGTALELARLALTLHQPEVWLAAASGLIRAWESAGPMPTEVSELLLNLVQTCWKVQSGSLRARLIQALQGFQTVEHAHSEAILALLVAIVDDKRAQAGWTPEQLNQLTVTIRHLRRGA